MKWTHGSGGIGISLTGHSKAQIAGGLWLHLKWGQRVILNCKLARELLIIVGNNRNLLDIWRWYVYMYIHTNIQSHFYHLKVCTMKFFLNSGFEISWYISRFERGADVNREEVDYRIDGCCWGTLMEIYLISKALRTSYLANCNRPGLYLPTVPSW